MELVTIVILSLLLVPLVAFTSGALRIALGLAFVLFFPGYTLIAALFPKKGDLGGIERVALSFGLSIAVVPLMGLVLNYTPWGIRLYPILVSVLLFIVVMSVIAWYRRRRLPPEERSQVQFRPLLSSLSGPWVLQSRWDRLLTILLLVAIVGAIGTLGYVIAKPKVGERFTEFYILGRYGRAEYYPGKFIMEKNKVVAVDYGGEVGEVDAQRGEVTLGIVNHEHRRATYQIGVRLNAGDIAVGFEGENRTLIGPIRLEPDEKWGRMISFAPLHPGDNQKLEFILYQDGVQYFQTPVYIWINAVERASRQ